jgi:hypothetical protein
VGGDGRVHVAGRRARPAERPPGVARPRVEPDGRAVGVHRVGRRPAEPPEHPAEPAVRLGRVRAVGLQFGRPPQGRLGPGQVADPLQGDAEVQVGRGVPGADPDRVPQRVDRLVVAAEVR